MEGRLAPSKWIITFPYHLRNELGERAGQCAVPENFHPVVALAAWCEPNMELINAELPIGVRRIYENVYKNHETGR